MTAVDLGAAFSQAYQGIQHLGNATTMILQWAFSLVGFNLPDWIARIIVILVSAYVLYSYSGKLSQILVFLLCGVIIATVLGVNLSSISIPGI